MHRQQKTTCSTDVLWSLPRLYLQVVHQCSHRKSSQWVRISLICWHWTGKTGFFIWLQTFWWISPRLWWRSLPAMRPMTADVLMTSPACMFSVAMIHLFLLPPATRAISADLRGPDWLFRIFREEAAVFGSWSHLHGSYRTSTTFSSKGRSSLPDS